jgi:FlaA1/EpsC-like NDP-sugar epimerase
MSIQRIWPNCITANCYYQRGVQLLSFLLAMIAAFLLRFDFQMSSTEAGYMALSLPIVVIVKSAVFRWYRLDHGWWRFVSVYDVLKLTRANMLASALSAVPIMMAMGPGYPRSVILLDFVLCLLATTGVRVGGRLIADSPAGILGAGEGKRTVIYGAGVAGVMLLRELRASRSLGYSLQGFVDDNPNKQGIQILGTPVLGAGASLKEVVRNGRIHQVLIAIPSASRLEMTQILSHCHAAGVRFKTVPSLSEMISGRRLSSQIRDVRVEDLLGRHPVHLDTAQIRIKLADKTVLVTGAGGSIGSELCRQIAQFGPQVIVGYDIAESALFHLNRQMLKQFPSVAFFAEVGSIQNLSRMEDVLRRHRPAILYHAAAYKHVPIMEEHAFEAVENNIFGTHTVTCLAAQYNVLDFVTISTDKAVRPTSVMGATKRVSELLMYSMQNSGTRFMAVRFGNVLESNGSVVPIFRQQIEEGGPVTITHPEMSRYFMTISEAAQLVLQASSMGSGGEIFVLDMGAPVKILDLARNLILLSGLQPDEDIKIEFTDIRPGEKLHEELSRLDENAIPTRHAKIRIYAGNGHSSAESMGRHIEQLQRICRSRDLPQLVSKLKEIVPDYQPSDQILKRAGAAGQVIQINGPHPIRVARV